MNVITFTCENVHDVVATNVTVTVCVTWVHRGVKAVGVDEGLAKPAASPSNTFHTPLHSLRRAPYTRFGTQQVTVRGNVRRRRSLCVLR